MNYIIKTIQGCNLSCVYCYEQPQNRRNVAMRLDQALHLLQKVYDYYSRNNPEEVLAFHWHGGEPMLLGAEFFDQILGFQRRVFSNTIRWYNTMQSNLTLLDDTFIDLLQRNRDRLGLGISFDFFGNDRVDTRNRSINDRVWRNVRRLQEAGIATNFITMLTRGNVDHIDQIYDLIRFEETSIRFNQVFGAPRKRPFNRPPVRLTNREFTEALKRITERWIHDSECAFIVENAERVMTKIVNPALTRICWYERNCLEGHMSVCPDGAVYPCDSIYFKELCYGNILEQPYEQLLASQARMRLLAALNEVRPECVGCSYVDYCNGGCPMRWMLSRRTQDFRRATELRLGKDPLCAAHCGLFETIGAYLAQEGVVEPDWTRRKLPLPG